MNRSFEKCERKGTKEHLVKGEVCGGEEQRCMNGLRESWRQTNRGQMELACDGSCPGLILSVCAGWQEGCTGKLNTHTHTDMEREPQIDLGIPSGLCVFPYDHQLSSPPPISLGLLLHIKSLSNCKRTHFIHTPYQTSAVSPAGSWPGKGQESPGSRFMWRLLVHAQTRSSLPLHPYSVSTFCFPCICKWFTLFWHRHVKK